MSISAMRCPTCGEPMTFEPGRQLIDCPAGHRVTTDPDRRHTPKSYLLLTAIEAVLNPADRSNECEHHWITIEQSGHESLNECVACSTWQITPGREMTPRHRG